MTAREIIKNFIKNNSKVTITEKQKSWLLSQCKNEKLVTRGNGHDSTYVYFSNCYFEIRPCKYHIAAYGGFVGTRNVPGKWIIEKFIAVKFTDTGYTAHYGIYEVESLKERGYKFEIINPITK